MRRRSSLAQNTLCACIALCVGACASPPPYGQPIVLRHNGAVAIDPVAPLRREIANVDFMTVGPIAGDTDRAATGSVDTPVRPAASPETAPPAGTPQAPTSQPDTTPPRSDTPGRTSTQRGVSAKDLALAPVGLIAYATMMALAIVTAPVWIPLSAIGESRKSDRTAKVDIDNTTPRAGMEAHAAWLRDEVTTRDFNETFGHTLSAALIESFRHYGHAADAASSTPGPAVHRIRIEPTRILVLDTDRASTVWQICARVHVGGIAQGHFDECATESTASMAAAIEARDTEVLRKGLMAMGQLLGARIAAKMSPAAARR